MCFTICRIGVRGSEDLGCFSIYVWNYFILQWLDSSKYVFFYSFFKGIYERNWKPLQDSNELLNMKVLLLLCNVSLWFRSLYFVKRPAFAICQASKPAGRPDKPATQARPGLSASHIDWLTATNPTSGLLLWDQVQCDLMRWGHIPNKPTLF